MGQISPIYQHLSTFSKHIHLMFDLHVVCMCLHLSSSAVVLPLSIQLHGPIPGSLNAQQYTQGHQPINLSLNDDKNTFKINRNIMQKPSSYMVCNSREFLSYSLLGTLHVFADRSYVTVYEM